MSRTKEEKLTSTKALSRAKHCDTTWSFSYWKREALMNSWGQYRDFIVQQWAFNFKEPFPSDAPLDLVSAKIMYHLDKQEKDAKHLKPSPSWERNYKAAMKMDLQAFDADMRTLLEISIKHRELSPEKEQEMKVKRKAAAEKAQKTKSEKAVNKGPKKGATWYGLFKANHSAKLTDAELAKAMTKAMNDGHVYTEQEVVKNRSFYNFGAFGKNYPKPAKPLEQFKDEKEDKAEKKPAKADKKSKK